MLPPDLQSKYLARFDELIDRGETICNALSHRDIALMKTDHASDIESNSVVDERAYETWKHNCATLLSQIISQRSIHRAAVEALPSKGRSKRTAKQCLSLLRAIREDFQEGYLENLMLEFEAEIASDYMGQAERLLNEGPTGKYDYVPAAVLAGAVLEKALRTLCEQQNPPLAVVKVVNGKENPLTMYPLIDNLRSVDAFNKPQAQQLRAWADIRNSAAHGKFDEFNRSQVEMMVAGIGSFLAQYLH